ncbi:hypothetical protein [Prevotella sp. 10(H)]|uniref:hypothetical protein n=1 Tax=Prevotella sp. 10(H) TaxID=1158294 RepID=UPI0004A77866|nr:hypothetical protein [Prevotella sp. 10(H)]
MKIKVTFCILVLFFAPRLFAQVTIGLDESPSKGALLQLKSESVTNGGANAKAGLLLPRVELDPTNSNSGTDASKLVASLKLTLPLGTPFDAADHAGLMVYNITTKAVTSNAPFSQNKICPGVYIWNGSLWERMMSTECK